MKIWRKKNIEKTAYESFVEVIQGSRYVWEFSRSSVEVDETRSKRR